MTWLGSSDDPRAFGNEVKSQIEAIRARMEAQRAETSDPDYSRKQFEKLEAQMEDERARILANGRDDVALRAVHARQGLLCWVYEFHAGVRQHFSNSPHAALRTGRHRVDRDRFTAEEVRAAARYLAENGLIEVEYRVRDGVRRRAHLITRAGSECVENYHGNVAKYLDSQKRGETLISIGEIHGPAVVGNHGTQNNVTHNVGIQSEAMTGFVRDLLAALPSLQLGPDHTTRAQEALEEVNREVQRTGPDSERARGAFGRFVKGMIDAGPQAVTQLLLMIAQKYAGPSS
jgi:hypothetical protein